MLNGQFLQVKTFKMAAFVAKQMIGNKMSAVKGMLFDILLDNFFLDRHPDQNSNLLDTILAYSTFISQTFSESNTITISFICNIIGL